MTPDPAKSTATGDAGEALDALVSSLDGSSLEIVLQRRETDLGQRTRRAARSLAICWALAAVSILLPLAHFVLVPGFFLAGPYLAWRRYGERWLILGTGVPCPSCAAITRLEPGPEEWPLAVMCAGCRSPLSVSLR